VTGTATGVVTVALAGGTITTTMVVSD